MLPEKRREGRRVGIVRPSARRISPQIRWRMKKGRSESSTAVQPGTRALTHPSQQCVAGACDLKTASDDCKHGMAASAVECTRLRVTFAACRELHAARMPSQLPQLPGVAVKLNDAAVVHICAAGKAAQGESREVRRRSAHTSIGPRCAARAGPRQAPCHAGRPAHPTRTRTGGRPRG